MDQAFAQGGLPAIQAYLGPLMLFASTALYASYGDPSATTHSTATIPTPIAPNYVHMPGALVDEWQIIKGN